MAAAHLPLWLVLIIGSFLGLIGYGVQYLLLTYQISSLQYWHMLILSVLAGNSICWINTVCYIVSIRNFPSDHQVAVGLSTSYQGLTAKFYTVIVNALFSSAQKMKRARAYLLLNSILPAVVCIIAAPLIGDIKVGKPRRWESGFIVMFVITITTGIYAVISSLGLIESGSSPQNNLIGLGVLLLAPSIVPLGEKIKQVMKRKCLINRERLRVLDISGQEHVDESAEIMENGVKLGERGNISGSSCVKEEVGMKLMLKRVDFWLYFFVYMCGATLGLVFLNNLGQIAESRGYSSASSLVSLSSSVGFFGRLMPSLLDYSTSGSRYTFSRPASIAALMAPMSGAFFLLVNKTSLCLHISTGIIGVCTGAITSIAVSTTTELFGSTNFGVNHNLVVVNIPIGSFLFGYLAALFYRREANADGKCMGTECYRETFIIWGSLCFFGTLLALILYARTRKFYSQRE